MIFISRGVIGWGMFLAVAAMLVLLFSGVLHELNEAVQHKDREMQFALGLVLVALVGLVVAAVGILL